MEFLYYLMMIGGGAAMTHGFRLAGSRSGREGWVGIALLLGGWAAAFLGVLLAFAPRFFN
ncbi:MAG: hypothetical protein EHM19_04925 [Candidatus Latescibacterota bacterium]|nr:MAG: hypothetical protein EHM19_04925 [Candidatus Latescibacterota bacterium]